MERADVQEALKNKGFVEVDGGKDHVYYRFFHKGKDAGIVTKVSRGTQYRSLGNPLVSAMAKQLKLQQKDFRKFVECTLSEADYVAHLQKEKFLEEEEAKPESVPSDKKKR